MFGEHLWNALWRTTVAREASARATVSRRAPCSWMTARHAAKTELVFLMALRRSAVAGRSRCHFLICTPRTLL